MVGNKVGPAVDSASVLDCLAADAAATAGAAAPRRCRYRNLRHGRKVEGKMGGKFRGEGV